MKALQKSSLREIRKSLGRYLAILAIVALGVGFFCGLRVCRDAGVKSYALEQDDTYGRDPFDCVRASFAFLRAAGVTA